MADLSFTFHNFLFEELSKCKYITSENIEALKDSKIAIHASYFLSKYPNFPQSFLLGNNTLFTSTMSTEIQKKFKLFN